MVDLAAMPSVILLTALETAPAEPISDELSNDWVQSYGRHNKYCLEWNDACVNCVRDQSGGDYSCSKELPANPKESNA